MPADVQGPQPGMTPPGPKSSGPEVAAGAVVPGSEKAIAIWFMLLLQSPCLA